MGNIAFRMEIAAVLAVAAVMTACEKGGETVENDSPECEAFLAAATEYGLYSDGVVKTADTKAWLWCEAQGLGIVADTR